MNDDNLTIRLAGDGGIASYDDGASYVFDAAAASTIRSLVDVTRLETAPVSAPAVAALAEARQIVPSLRPTAALTETVHGAEVPLAPLVRRLDSSVSDTLERRQSHRQLGPLDLDDVATVLVHAARIRSWEDTEDGYQMTSRAAPSAGGRHPFELKVVVRHVRGLEAGAWHFDPARCSLVRQGALDSAAQDALEAVNAAADILEDAPATVFAIAHFDRTLSRYPAGMTLVWRDAGVLLGYLHLVACAAGIESCIVGTAGRLVFNPESPTGDVGALIMGTRL